MNKFLFITSCLFLLACAGDDETRDEGLVLEDIIIENVLFEYTKNLSNNTDRFRYEFRFTNPNSVTVEGTPIITYRPEPGGLDTTPLFNTLHPCISLSPGETCTVEYDENGPIVGMVEEVVLVELDYRIRE